MQEQLNLDRPEAPRFPLKGIPLMEMMEAISREYGNTGRLVR